MLPQTFTGGEQQALYQEKRFSSKRKALCLEIHFPFAHVWGCELGTAKLTVPRDLSSHEFCRNVSLKPSSGLERGPGKGIIFKI